MYTRQWVFCAVLWAGYALHAQQTGTDSVTVRQLDEVVVTDSRFALKRQYSGKTVIKISPREIERNQGRSVAELLNTKAGLEIAGSRGRQGEVLGVYARGGRGRQVLVLVDGVRMNDPSSSSQEYDLRLLSLGNVESIEIIKGASSTLYGTNAATAVISITTRKPAGGSFGAVLQSSVGSNQTADEQDYNLSEFNNSALLRGTAGRWDYAASIDQAYTEGLSSLVTPENEEDPFSRYNAGLKLGYSFSKNTRLQVYGNQSRFRSAYDESFGFTDAPYEYITEQKRAGLQAETGYGKGSLHLNAAYSEYDSENISAFPGTFTGSNQVVDLYNKYTFSESFYLLGGVYYLKDRANFEDPVDFTILDPYINGVYLTDFGLHLNAGLRLNTHSEYGEHLVYNVNPSFAIPAGEGYFKLMGSFSSSYITPSLTQLFGQFGANPELEPETDRTLEAGLEWAPGEELRMSALFFSRKEENYVFFDSAEFLYNNANSTIRARGLELETDWQPATGIHLSTNYTFTERSGDDAIRIPKHKANASLGIDLGTKTYASLQYAYNGTRPDTDFNTGETVSLEAFSLVDLYLSHELLSQRLKVFAAVTNLLNESYTEIVGFSTRGRNLRLGFRLLL